MLMATTQPTLGDSDNAKSEYRYVGLQTVLSLARTSHILHEYAADALWDTIPAFGILVYTLPHDIWSCERVGGGNANATASFELVRATSSSFCDVLGSPSLPVTEFEATTGGRRPR